MFFRFFCFGKSGAKVKLMTRGWLPYNKDGGKKRVLYVFRFLA